MAYMMAIYFLLLAGYPPAQTVQGNYIFRQQYLQTGKLPSRLTKQAGRLEVQQ